MIDGSEKRNRQLAFELHNSHVCEKRRNYNINLFPEKNIRPIRFGVISRRS